MLTFTIRRLVLAIPTLILISFVIFMLLQLAPGDPMAQVPLTVPPEVKEQMRQALGLGEPPLVQYGKWLRQVFLLEPAVFIDWMTRDSLLLGWLPDTALYSGELRVISWQTRSPVMEVVLERIPQTLWVVGLAYVVGILIVLILTLYFVASLASIKRGLYQLVPASKRERFIDLAEQISKSVGRFVIGQALLGLSNGVLTFVFLSVLGLILGEPIQYSALLAFIAFLFSLVPLVGTISGSVIITLAVWLFNDVPAVIVVGIWYLVYMQVEAYVLSPNIMNRAVKIPGAVVVVAALAGGTLLGILGALIAIPVAASILLIVKQVIVPRQNEL